MMVRFFIGLIAAFVAGFPAMAAANTLTLEPSSKWVLNYANDSCRLLRSFGTADEKVMLFIDQYAPGNTFKLMFMGKPVRNRKREPEVTFQFGPAEEPQTRSASTGKFPNGLPALLVGSRVEITPVPMAEGLEERRYWRALYSVNRSLERTAREKAIKSLNITNGVRKNLILQIGSMDEPMQAIRKCSWDTVGHWGLDVGTQKTLRRPAIPASKPSSWLTSSDYPTSMLRWGAEGLVNFRLMVDINGKVESCHIQDSTRPKEFDDAVCKGLMRSAEFEPAQDANGVPTRSFYNDAVRFKI